jgi:hypothetical protein
MKSIRSGVLWILSSFGALASTAGIADIPSAVNDCVSDLVETTPSSDFTILEGGEVVRHEPTGLEWRRCAEGMSWAGTGCTGSAISLNWQDALQYTEAVPGWRLPNVSELRSIVERCRTDPAINQQVFPDTPLPFFWSASPYALAASNAWDVNFFSGGGNWSDRSNLNRVRLVRGGRESPQVVRPGESYAGVTFGPNGAISVDSKALFEDRPLGTTEEPNFDYFYLRVYELGEGIRIVELYEVAEDLSTNLDDPLLAAALISAEGDVLEERIFPGN